MTLQLLTYAAAAWFVAVVAAKAIRYARTPIHVRWELYPVAHDPHAAHGGSYYEESEWWTREPKRRHLAALLAMAEEIFLLKGVWENNRRVWYWSLPFHWGLYATAGLVLVMVVEAVLAVVGWTPAAGLSPLLFYLRVAFGYGGLVLLGVGASGLLGRRLSDPALRRLSAPIDYCNLAAFLVLAAASAVARVAADPSLDGPAAYVQGLVRLQPVELPGPCAAEVLLWSLLLVYLPLTRMSHFVAKYFAYHHVRWEDEPNRPGGRLEARIREALAFGVSWSAPHIQKGKTWAEVATQLPPEDSSR